MYASRQAVAIRRIEEKCFNDSIIMQYFLHIPNTSTGTWRFELMTPYVQQFVVNIVGQLKQFELVWVQM